MLIPVTKSTHLKPHPSSQKLGFGQYFTDHIFCVNYSEDRGWFNPRVVPYEPLEIDPGASVLHYGQALFEGIKAFRQNSGNIVVFRPEFNWERLQKGAARLCMQAPPKEMMLEGIKKLVEVDQAWVPTEKGCSLYIRPTLIGTEAFLGVRPAKEYLFYVILSPVSSYYQEGAAPIKIWVEETYVRAARGGLGATKAGANYAASLLAALEAKKHGYAQVLWLDVDHEYIEEVGTMNVFFRVGDEILTPALSDSILAGGVRDTCIQLLRSWGYKVSEKKVSIKEIIEAHKKGELKEAFGTGTAAVISPVGELFYKGQKWTINNEKMGEVAKKLYEEISAIQYGDKPDTHQWLKPINNL